MGTVTVISKLPHALEIDYKGKKVEIKGANSTKIRDQNGLIPEGSYGATELDESLWTAWSTENASLYFLHKGYVFAKPTAKSATDEAEGKRELKTGLEGLSQNMQDERLAPSDRKRLKGEVVIN